MSRASPSNRSMTTPTDSGTFLSGSASTTSPTVHFQPLAADLYVADLLTSSLNRLAHSSEKASTAIAVPSSSPTGLRREGYRGRDAGSGRARSLGLHRE